MSPEVLSALIGAGSALLVATVGSIVTGAIAQRAATDELIRDVRMKVHPWIWRATEAVSHWPRDRELNEKDALKLHRSLRAWYYGLSQAEPDDAPDDEVRCHPGGLYLSENAKERYNELQALTDKALQVIRHEGRRL